MKTIDLNCDMGESFGRYTIGMDRDVMSHITSANIACGWHAGDPVVMKKTVETAVARQVGVGAHPGYPDLMGFGRRAMACTEDEIHAYLVYQVGALQAFCRTAGTRLNHVKPHGALYLDAVASESTARGVARAILDLDPDDPYPVAGTYVLCTRGGNPPRRFVRNAERARDIGWPVIEIDTGHDLMVTEPEKTAKILMGVLN